MMMTMFTMNFIMSIIFLTLTHPLSMGMILLIQTITVSLISGNFNFNYWYSYILFLILVGGMLILFMYMTSIASNEKFSFNMKYLLLTMLMMIPFVISTTNMEINLMNSEMLAFMVQASPFNSFNKYTNFPSNILLMFMIVYLLLALVVTVKMTNIKKGPIRQMN